MNDKIKNKVRTAISLYKDIYRGEYNAFVLQMNDVRNAQKNSDAEVLNEDGTVNEGIRRELYRMPEKLDYLIISNLDELDLPTLETREYAAWFMREFPEFRTSQTI